MLQFHVLVDLSLALIDHQPLDSSHSPACSFVDSTWSTFSVLNSLLREHLHVAVSELEHYDPLGLGEVKLCLLVFDPLDHLWITNIY